MIQFKNELNQFKITTMTPKTVHQANAITVIWPINSLCIKCKLFSLLFFGSNCARNITQTNVDSKFVRFYLHLQMESLNIVYEYKNFEKKLLLFRHWRRNEINTKMLKDYLFKNSKRLEKIHPVDKRWHWGINFDRFKVEFNTDKWLKWIEDKLNTSQYIIQFHTRVNSIKSIRNRKVFSTNSPA